MSSRRPRPLLGRIDSYRRLYVTAALVLFFDQLTKFFIFKSLPYGTYHPQESVEIIPGFFYIVHIGNEGAAWGILSGWGGALALFAVIALVLIYKFRHTLELGRTGMQYAFGMLVGGVIGNLIDRLLHGHVIDFLDFHLPVSIPWILEGGRYPAFNIADCGITIGVFTYILIGCFAKETPTGESAQS